MASFLKKRKSFTLSKPIKPLPLDLRHNIRSGINISTVTQCAEELVFNSIDANATSISVRVNLVDFKLRVEDNGIGLCKEDLEMIGQRHATSKCSSLQDLTQLRYFGFRGEALASIIDLSAGVEVYTNSKDEIDSGPYYRKFKNGKPFGSIHPVVESKKPNHGLTIVVHGLLSKFPVRQNRIETPVELEEIKKSLEHIYLINPFLSLELRNDANGKILLSTAGVPSTSDAFKCLYLQRLGKSHSLHEVFFNFDVFVCSGWFSTSTHHSKSLQFVYVNRRFLTRNKIHRYVHDCLFEILGLNKSNPYSPKSSEKHPIFLVNIVCGFTEVDLTVDPKKTVVEFKDWNKVIKAMEGLVQVFQVELVKENKAVMNRSTASKQLEPHGGVGFFDKANSGAQAGNFRNSSLSTREVKRAIHSRLVLRGGDNKSPKFDSDIEDTPPQRDIKSFMAQRQRNSSRFPDKDSPSPPPAKVISRKIDKFKPKEKAQMPVRRLSSFKRKIEDVSPVQDKPRLKTGRYVWDYINNRADYIDHTSFEKSKDKEPQFDSDIEFEISPPMPSPNPNLLRKEISRLLPQADPYAYPPQPQRKMDAFVNKQKPRISPITKQEYSPRNKLLGNFEKLRNSKSPLEDQNFLKELYQGVDSHLQRSTTYEPYLNSEVLYYEFMATETGANNFRELTGLRSANNNKNFSQEIHEDQQVLSPFNQSRINCWVESTTRFLNHTPFTPSEKQKESPPGSPVVSDISKLHISEKFLTPPGILQPNPLNKPPNFTESQDLISYSQQENNNNDGQYFFPSPAKEKFQLTDFFGNEDSSIFKNIFGTVVPRNHFQAGESGVQLNHSKSINQSSFPITSAPFNDLFSSVPLRPPEDSGLKSQYFSFDDPRSYRNGSAPLPDTHLQYNIEIGRKNVSENAEIPERECIDLASPARKGASVGVEEIEKRMNDFISTPPPEATDQFEDDAIWDSWKVEVTTDKEGTDWLKSADSQGNPIYINMNTGVESYGMTNVTNTRIVSANEVRKFRHNWLRRYYPKGSKLFWSPRGKKSSLAKDGNIELAEKGNTILGEAVQQCITGAMDSSIFEKWREGCSQEEFGEQQETDTKEKNAILVSEFWERPNDPVELPILNLNASEITFNNSSKQLFSFRISKDDLLGVKVISQLDKKFIVAKLKLTSIGALEAGTPDILALFDQHAVHERIRLETLVNEMYIEKEGKKVICSVHILPPFELSLTSSEVRLIGNYPSDFEDSGLSIETIGLETVRVHTAPKCFAEKISNEVKNCRDDTMNRLIQMLIEEQIRHLLDAKGTLHQMPKTIFNVLCSQACRGAIKFGDQLSREACEELIEKLKSCKMPFQCAHGRPSIAPLFDLKSIVPTETY